MEALHTDRIDCIHVSDLLKDCSRYVAYEKNEPTSMSTEDMKSIIFGQMLHKQIILDKDYNEVPFLWNYVNEETFNRDTWKDNKLSIKNKWDFIAGSADDIIQLKGDYVICDKKTTARMDTYSLKKGIPYDNHRAQTNMYRVMLKKCYDIDAKWGCNLYISNMVGDKTVRDQPRPIVYKLDPISETEELMVEKASKIRAFMTTKVMPEPKFNFLCDGMCQHGSKCFTETRKHFNE